MSSNWKYLHRCTRNWWVSTTTRGSTWTSGRSGLKLYHDEDHQDQKHFEDGEEDEHQALLQVSRCDLLRFPPWWRNHWLRRWGNPILVSRTMHPSQSGNQTNPIPTIFLFPQKYIQLFKWHIFLICILPVQIFHDALTTGVHKCYLKPDTRKSWKCWSM